MSPCPVVPLNSVVKTQMTRLMDVFLLGPFMVYAATKIPPKHQAIKCLLVFAGWGTIAYNAHNFALIRRSYGVLP
jgi:hypothetical protein